VFAQRILIKARSYLEGAAFSLGGAPVTFEAKPLFKSIGCGAIFRTAPDRTWYVMTPAIALDEPNIWDVCHSLVRMALVPQRAHQSSRSPTFSNLGSWAIPQI
jgi:hypothetical protein